MSISQFRERVTGRDLKSEQSVNQYITWIKRFREWHDGETITEGVLRDFDDELNSADPLGIRSDPYSYQTRMIALSAVAKWAEVMEDTQIHRNISDIVMGETAEFNPTVLSRETVDRILDEPCSVQGCKAIRHVGYDAIMRSSEVTRMRPDDVNPDDGTVYVRAAKGSEPRNIGVNDRTMELLEAQVDWVTSQFQNPAKLFYNTSMSKGWSANAWTKHFIRKHHEAGFHAFAKHTPIVHRLEDGEEFGAVYLRARHKNPSMTAKYASIAGREAPDYA